MEIDIAAGAAPAPPAQRSVRVARDVARSVERVVQRARLALGRA